MERGLPVGVAPDIHVSLVMLPEECRSLSDKRYPIGEMKLKMLGKAVRYGLSRRLRRREEQFAPALKPMPTPTHPASSVGEIPPRSGGIQEGLGG